MKAPAVIVSGLPRSGTSLLMAMLQAGGLSILTDSIREPDESNPRGYFEHAAVKALARDASWLWEAHGSAVKIVIPLLQFLPAGFPARVLLLSREPDEVIASQTAMLLRSGRTAAAPPEVLKKVFMNQWRETLALLISRAPEVLFLTVAHRSLVEEPAAAAAAINHFLGGALDESAMARCVDPALYRQRS